MKIKVLILIIGLLCPIILFAQCNMIKYRNPKTDENGYISKTLGYRDSFQNLDIRVRIKREGDLYLIKMLFLINAPLPTAFSIKEKHPLAFSIGSGTYIKAYPYDPVHGDKNSLVSVTNDLGGRIRPEYSIEYRVEEKDMEQLLEGYISGIRLYYSSEHKLPGYEVDDLGYYLFWDLRSTNAKEKPIKKNHKVNEKLDGLFRCVLEAE